MDKINQYYFLDIIPLDILHYILSEYIGINDDINTHYKIKILPELKDKIKSRHSEYIDWLSLSMNTDIIYIMDIPYTL